MTGRRFALLQGLLLAGLSCLADPARAQPWDPARAVAQPEWVWADAQQLDSSQARISVQTFHAPAPLPEVARRLAAASGQRLTRLQWAGPLLVLSGGRGTEHWLAQLQPRAGGTAGLVSRLAPAAPAGADFDPAALAPPGARRVLQVRGRNAAAPVSLSSFDCPGTPAQVAAAVRRALHAAGWSEVRFAGTARLPIATDVARPDPADAASLPADWRHSRDGRLSVHVHARARSVALMFWHHPQEPS